MVDLGTDINSNWSLNGDGDLNLVKDNDNLAQSIINRLNCYKPNLDIYYEGYGGFLASYFGRRRAQETLGFVKIEVDTILQQDPRLTDFTSSFSYDQDGAVLMSLSVNVGDEEIELNFILNGDDGVVEDAS